MPMSSHPTFPSRAMHLNLVSNDVLSELMPESCETDAAVQTLNLSANELNGGIESRFSIASEAMSAVLPILTSSALNPSQRMTTLMPEVASRRRIKPSSAVSKSY